MSRANGTPSKWWQSPFSMLQTNLREIDATMDVNEVAGYIHEYGADAWLIGVGGILAHYPSTLPFQTHNPYLKQRASGDLIADAVQAAHSRGLRLLARMDFSKISSTVAKEHPEWCFRDPAGELQTHTAELVSVCPSGVYYQEKMFDIISEVCGRYPLDGFFFNWMSMNEIDYDKKYRGVCHCESCQRRWTSAQTGQPLPDGPSDAAYPAWLRFSRAIIDDLVARVRALIASKLPQAGLILGQTADIMFHEANNAVGRELWQHATGEWTSVWKSFRPDIPVLVNSTVFLDMPYRMAAENDPHFAQYLIQAMSRGGNPSTYTMGIPNKIPYTYYEVGSDINRFFSAHKDVYTGMKPAATMGLIRPIRSQMSGPAYDDAVKEFRGLYRALQEVHTFFDVLGLEHLSGMSANGSIKRYQTIILPDTGALLDGDVQILDDWVNAGGQLVLTGSSGLKDNTIQLKSSPVERHERSVSDRVGMYSTYISPNQRGGKEHYYTGPTIPLCGAYHFMSYKPNTAARYHMLGRAPHAPPEYAYGNEQSDYPGCVGGSHGQGTTTSIPWTIGRTYWELGLTPVRQFFLECLPTSRDPIVLQLPEQVEATINETNGRRVVHLLNMSGATRSNNFGPHLPIEGGSLRLEGGKGKVTARALRAGVPLAVDAGVIKLPRLELFEVIVLE